MQEFLASFAVDIDEAGVSRLQKILRDNRDLAASCPNLDEFLFLPVAAGFRKQHELRDGTYTLDDLLDITELIRVRRENEYRAAEAVRQ